MEIRAVAVAAIRFGRRSLCEGKSCGFYSRCALGRRCVRIVSAARVQSTRCRVVVELRGEDSDGRGWRAEIYGDQSYRLHVDGVRDRDFFIDGAKRAQ